MSAPFRRLLWWLGYRLGFAPWDTGRPIPMLVEAVEGQEGLVPGRALDIGCGSGRNAIYLARHGWDVTGVDLVGHAITLARRNAEAAGVSVRFVEGDVTRLDDLDIGQGFDLLIDSGCYHAVPVDRRDAYVAGVSTVASPGARLLMFGVGATLVPRAGMTEEELRQRFTGWRLVSAVRMSPEEVRGYIRTRRRFEVAMARRWFDVWRYRLELVAQPQPGVC
jgi:cyclopropane fatty-acyl-phospholipid synthase-like methyltransferase